MHSQEFDLVVIGSGPGGYPAAIRASGLGLKVALIEMGEVGGTCLNRGCIPSKALIRSARFYHEIGHAAEFGVEVEKVSLDFPKMVDRSRKVVEKIRSSLESLIKAHGVTLFRGKAKFVSPSEIKVLGEENLLLKTKKTIIASGSEPRIVPAFPTDGVKIHDSTSLLLCKKLPESLVVIGGGVIGCEFASMMNLLGVKVTIVELLERILSTESPEVSKHLTRVFKKRGIEVLTGVSVESVTANGAVLTKLKNGEEIRSESALVSVGRKVNVDELDLAKAGLSLNERGALSVNDQMETAVPGIYAIGDVLGRFWLAHVATHQGVVAAQNAAGVSSKMHENAVPSVIFTDPEVASVGLTVEKAREKGYRAEAGSFPFMALGKAHALGNTDGFAEVVIDQETGQILGAQVIGDEASTLIAEMTLAVANELTVECLTETIHAHPTLPEAWHEAALVAAGMPLHLPPRRRP